MIATRPMFTIMKIVLIALLLASCSTVKGRVGEEAFQRQNQPVRNLKVAVFLQERSWQDANELVQEASQLLYVQTGITLEPVYFGKMRWHGTDPGEMVDQLADFAHATVDDFDMVIGCDGRINPLKTLAKVVIPIMDWDGCIDDELRRYIVLRKMDVQVLLHEICHAFILTHDHSPAGGLMAVPRISIDPFGILVLNRTLYLNEKDRTEVLRNKWRDFNVPVEARHETAGV